MSDDPTRPITESAEPVTPEPPDEPDTPDVDEPDVRNDPVPEEPEV